MKNPNPKRSNKNALYIAMSGAGKSQALKQNQEIPASGARVLLFDPNHDHQAARVRGGVGKFAATVMQGIDSGRGFRLAWDTAPTVDNFEAFCRVVMAALDGDHETYVLAEELSLYNERIGKAAPMAAAMMNTGRKYGLIFHGTTQRPTEIPKTYYSQCETLWIGRQKTMAACKAMAAELSVSWEALKNLPDLTFYLDKPGAGGPELVTLQYQD
jgi:hypothetical protein